MSFALASRSETSRRPRSHPTVRWLSGGVLGLAMVVPAFADPAPVIFTGTPEQVIPTYSEVGVGNFTTTTGTTSINGGTTTTGGGGTSTSTSSDLTTMESQSWGAEAAQNASALGVDPNALAATCVIESQCQNVGGTGTVAGAFQMTASTYNAELAKALANNPSLADNIVSGSAGQMDPATESIAAAQYLKDSANYLVGQGVSDPTVLDSRGYYNFGPGFGAAIANADSSDNMTTVLQGESAETLKSNGITPGETVGQWRAAVSSKIGTAANTPVLTG